MGCRKILPPVRVYAGRSLQLRLDIFEVGTTEHSTSINKIFFMVPFISNDKLMQSYEITLLVFKKLKTMEG